MEPMDRAGREYAHVAFHGLPLSPPTPQIHLAGQWHPMAWWDDYDDPEWHRQAKLHKITQAQSEAGTHRLARIRVAGPGADPGPDDTVVLTAARTLPRAKLDEATTEVLIRPLDPIDLAD